jgi:hypothetical protein
MSINRFFLVLISFSILIAIFGSGVYAATDTLMALQGNVQQNGVDVTSGNITVNIYDSYSGGTLIYNSSSDFYNTISNGKYDIMLGNGTQTLSLNYGGIYYLEMFVNGENLSFGGLQRQVFQSSVGNVSFNSIPGSGNIAFINQSITWNSGQNISTGAGGWFKGLFDWVIDSGSANYLSFNGTTLNVSSGITQWLYNQTTPAISYVTSNGFLTSSVANNTYLNYTPSGDINFNKGWQNGGVSIIGGSLFAQTVYVYNITSLGVSNLDINGSILPLDFDNTFDVGNATWRWANGYFASDVFINNNSVKQWMYNQTDLGYGIVNNSNAYLARLGIGISAPTNPIHINQSDVDGLGINLRNDLSSGSSPYLSIIQAGSRGYNVEGWANSSVIEGASGAGLAISSFTGDMKFQTGNSRIVRMTLTNANGYLGIGTASPQGMLNVVNGSTTTLANFTSQVGATYGGVFIDSYGRRFIATGMPTGATFDTATLAVNAINIGDVNRKLLGVGQTNVEKFSVDVEGDTRVVGNLSVGTSAFYVDSTNTRVGIGTTTPANKLDVSGNVSITGDTNRLGSTYSGGIAGTKNVILELYGNNSNGVAEVGTQELMRLTRPTRGAGPYTETVGFAVGSWGVASSGQTRTRFDINLKEAGTHPATTDITVMSLLSNGKIGIGTTTPAYLLDVSGNFSANQTLYVTNNGLVGIGTTTPTQLLDVRGIGNFSGTVYINNGTNVATLGGGSGIVNNSNAYLNTLSIGASTITANTKVEVAGNVNITGSNNLTIGGGLIYWDSTNARLVIKVS